MAEIRRYRYDIFSSGRYVLVEMEDDTLWYLGLREWAQVPEAPPNAHEYRTLRRGWGSEIDNSRGETDCDPSPEHVGVSLLAGFGSALESVYVLDNGAAIRFFPQNFSADASARTYRIHYLSPERAHALGLVAEKLAARADFAPLPRLAADEVQRLYPMEGAFIVRPGLGDLPCGMEHALRVDFVQLEESMLKPTCEGSVFRAVAPLLAERLGATCDGEPQIDPGYEAAPHVCRLLRGEETVAELTTHYLPEGDAPYHDCNVLQLCYRAEDSAAVEAALQSMLAAHPSVRLSDRALL